MLNFKFDIITISETKIQETTQPTFDVILQNYNLYQTSTESSSGGTLIYVSKKLNSKIRGSAKMATSEAPQEVGSRARGDKREALGKTRLNWSPI